MKVRKMTAADRQRVCDIVVAAGVFRDDEITVAEELIDDAIRKPGVDYHVLCAEARGQVVGYICYGRVPLTLSGWDLYWIAVDPSQQGKGIGALLIREMERWIAAEGGCKVYIDTSSLPLYAAARRLYEKCDYTVAAVLPDFFRPGDDKVLYSRDLSQPVG